MKTTTVDPRSAALLNCATYILVLAALGSETAA